MIVIVDEMKKFRELLDQNGIEWVDDSEALDTERYICRTHPKNHERWSVINGFGTYGGYDFDGKNKGLLEIMFEGEVLGHRKAEETYKLVEIIELSERANNAAEERHCHD